MSIHIFGGESKKYQQGRKAYASEVIKYLGQWIHPSSEVLDIACGTGLATRQLCEITSEVIHACDSDERMLAVAQEQDTTQISYYHARADNMPFETHQFDAVTIFGAFHWFTDAKSTDEIRRVLRPNGVICVINKNDLTSWRKELQGIMEFYSEKHRAYVKEGYDPVQILLKAGFQRPIKKAFRGTEEYTREQFAKYVQSTSMWADVPGDRRGAALEDLIEHFSETKGNPMVRALETVVVTARTQRFTHSAA